MPLERTNFGPYASAATFGTGVFTTSAFTPPAHCLLVVRVGASSEGGAGDIESSLSISDSIDGATPWSTRLTSPDALSWEYGSRIFSREIGSNPASMTISVDCGAEDVHAYKVEVFAYTGYDRINPFGATASGTTNATTGAAQILLNRQPLISSEILAFVDQQVVTALTVTPGQGWTELSDTNTTDTWHAWHSQARRAFGGIIVRWEDLTATGSSADASMIAIEVRAAPQLGKHPPPPAGRTGAFVRKTSSIQGWWS